MIDYRSTLKNNLKITQKHQNLLGDRWMILDIETTGFHRQHCYMNILGLIYVTGDQVVLSQLFNEDGKSEYEIIKTFLASIKSFNPSYIVTYNGRAFDFPFIEARMRYHKISDPCPSHLNIDLYRLVMGHKKQLDLPNYKLKTIENFLDINREDQISGKENIDMYLDYLKSRDEDLLKKILLHNHEDMENIMPLLELLEKLDANVQFISSRFEVKGKWHYVLDKHIKNDFVSFQLNTDNMASYYGEWIVYENDLLKLPIKVIDTITILDVQKIYGVPFSQFDKQSLIIKNEDIWLNDNIKSHLVSILTYIKDEQ